jgi:hypothetical protein
VAGKIFNWRGLAVLLALYLTSGCPLNFDMVIGKPLYIIRGV